MWRSGGANRNGNGAGSDGNGGAPQLVAVAVDSDKNSQHALKWAADHIITRGHIFVILHVRSKITSIPTPTGYQLPIDEVEDDVAAAVLEQIDLQTKELLLPFQCFCSRRGLQCREVILDDNDIPKAIVDFVIHQSVDKLVLGASSRNALIRTFRQADVPTSVSKTAPDFCSVYIVSKGKISSVRPARHPNKYSFSKQIREFEAAGNQFQSIKSEPDIRCNAAERSALVHGSRIPNGNDYMLSERKYGHGNGGRTNGFSQAAENYNNSYQSVASCPSPSRTSIDRPPCYYPREYGNVEGRQSRLSNMYTPRDESMRCYEGNKSGGTYWSSGSKSSGFEDSPPFSAKDSTSSWSNNSSEDVDDEIRRLKLELKQKRDMYESSSMEAQFKKADGELQTEARSGEQSTLTALHIAVEDNYRPKSLTKEAQATEKKNVEESQGFDADRSFSQAMLEKSKLPDGFSSDVRYRRYTTEAIQKATNNFSDALKIGEGGYGPVYKSTLDHTLVAIKILRPDAAQGMKQFQQEVEVLSTIRHPNMVLLMGACPENGCLVYEFMANGSLEDRLFCLSNTPPLSWQLRFKIAAEIATGLLFLHQTKPEPLVHRDLKPANILLDHNFVSKIADVGLARLIPPPTLDSSTQYHMTAAAGTFCYIDPEYQKTGMVGTKSDIYALGIILLQLVTAAPPMGLAHIVESAMEKGKFEELLDPKVTDWPVDDTLKLARLGLQCSELRRKDRPELGSVVLPELNRLRALADSTLETPWMHPRSMSYKESARYCPMGMPFDNGPLGGASCA